MFQVEIKDEGVGGMLGRLSGGFHDTTPLMRALAGALETVTEDNFAAQGRPRWLGLSPATKKRRGAGAHMILQDTGRLAGSVSTDYGRDYARVGTNVVYAPIHQFGGKAGRGRKVTIPARPFLPVGKNGELQPEARAVVLGEMQSYLAGLVRA